MWHICFLSVYVSVFLSFTCALLEFLTRASGTALVLGLCLHLGTFSCSLWLPLGSVWLCVLDQVGWFCSALRGQTPTVDHSPVVLVPLLIYNHSTCSWILCLKRDVNPFFLQYWHIYTTKYSAHSESVIRCKLNRPESPLGWLGILFSIFLHNISKAVFVLTYQWVLFCLSSKLEAYVNWTDF